MAPRSKKIRAPSVIFFGYRKSRECSPKIFDFRANGIPTGESVDFFDTLKEAPKGFLSVVHIRKQSYLAGALDSGGQLTLMGRAGAGGSAG